MDWPPAGIGPDLPATVRWLARDREPATDPAAKWYGLPAGACGALVFAWRRPGEAAPVSVSVLAVSDAGGRVSWFGGRRVKVRTVGPRAGATFEARADAGDGPAHVCEGEIDALALSLAPWCGPGRVLAAGATAGMVRAVEALSGTGGPVTLHSDGDPAGRGAVERARHAIEAAGWPCRVEWYAIGQDPAAELAERIGERAAIQEHDGGCIREIAERDAWRNLLQEDDR